MKNIIILLRPHHYIKNIFILAPLFFSFSINKYTINNSILAFFLFSFLASSIYIFNDICDINEDRQHPIKKNRPLANGSISINFAYLSMIFLSVTTLVVSFLFDFNLFVILFIYFTMNIIYSIKLKHIALVDIFIISIGFILRLFSGSIVSKVYLSPWIIIMTFLLALFLAIAKRRDDVLLSLNGKATRKNISGYNLEFVNASMIFMAAIIVVAYILYSLSEEVISRIGSDKIYLTTFFVILGIFRYMQITFVDQRSGSPVNIVFRDKFLQITIFLWIFIFYLVVNLMKFETFF
jgi:decaprenyl-phosphate phosphoribosyltransferase